MLNGSVAVSTMVAFPSHLIPRYGSDAVKSVAPFSVTMLEKLGAVDLKASDPDRGIR